MFLQNYNICHTEARNVTLFKLEQTIATCIKNQISRKKHILNMRVCLIWPHLHIQWKIAFRKHWTPHVTIYKISWKLFKIFLTFSYSLLFMHVAMVCSRMNSVTLPDSVFSDVEILQKKNIFCPIWMKKVLLKERIAVQTLF